MAQKPQSSKSVPKTEHKMQLALEAAGRAAYKEACHFPLATPPKINSHDDDDDDDDADDEDDNDDNGSKWKCQVNVRQLIKKLVTPILFYTAGKSGDRKGKARGKTEVEMG